MISAATSLPISFQSGIENPAGISAFFENPAPTKGITLLFTKSFNNGLGIDDRYLYSIDTPSLIFLSKIHSVK